MKWLWVFAGVVLASSCGENRVADKTPNVDDSDPRSLTVTGGGKVGTNIPPGDARDVSGATSGGAYGSRTPEEALPTPDPAGGARTPAPPED